MPEVRLERTLRVPADLAYEALGEMLQAIADQEGPWRGFALHVSLGDLHLPDVGYVAVPIQLQRDARIPRTRAIVRHHVSKPRTFRPHFPTFKGTMGVEPARSWRVRALLCAAITSCRCSSSESCSTRRLTPRVADRSLENFVDEIGAACEARVNQREAEFARYHFYAHNLR